MTAAYHPPQLIIALDLPDADALPDLLRRLPPAITYFKVGFELFIADGPKALSILQAAGKKIFLDLKLHDIPNTVQRAVDAAARRKVAMLTVHAAGGRAMLKAAAEAAASHGKDAPLLLAVTTLTSLTAVDLQEIGVTRTVEEQSQALTAMAIASGIGGVVAAVAETRELRRRFGGQLAIVTPGIRPAQAAVGDQKRIATPAAAVEAGASFLVVGRPILAAPDPAAAAAAIMDEIQRAAHPKV